MKEGCVDETVIVPQDALTFAVALNAVHRDRFGLSSVTILAASSGFSPVLMTPYLFIDRSFVVVLGHDFSGQRFFLTNVVSSAKLGRVARRGSVPVTQLYQEHLHE